MQVRVAAAVAETLEGLSIAQLNAHRTGKLEPLLARATAYLKERNALKTRGGTRAAEMLALESRIAETKKLVVDLRAGLKRDAKQRVADAKAEKERVRMDQINRMLIEVAELTDEPIDTMSIVATKRPLKPGVSPLAARVEARARVEANRARMAARVARCPSGALSGALTRASSGTVSSRDLQASRGQWLSPFVPDRRAKPS